MKRIKQTNIITFSQFFYYACWFFKQLFGIRKPLIHTMVIHFGCNLSCEHCDIKNQIHTFPKPTSISFGEAQKRMIELYKKGCRVCYFEGGEPTIWKDGANNLKTLILEAKRIGYFTTGYTTNGTGRLFTESDVISVSLDGPEKIHDTIRQNGCYKSLFTNLDTCRHGNIFANMTLTKTNYEHIKETVEIVKNHPSLQGIMMNFITPPPTNIALSLEEKKQCVTEILQLKKEGYPILNSKTALKKLLKENWQKKCPLWMSLFTLPNSQEIGGCPMQSDQSCQKCGFNAPREYQGIAAGNVFSTLEMAAYFAFRRTE